MSSLAEQSHLPAMPGATAFQLWRRGEALLAEVPAAGMQSA